MGVLAVVVCDVPVLVTVEPGEASCDAVLVSWILCWGRVVAPCRRGAALLVSRHSESPQAICARVSCLVIAVGFGRTVPASDAVGKTRGGVYAAWPPSGDVRVPAPARGDRDVNPALKGCTKEKGLTPKRTGYRRVGRSPFRARLAVRPASPCAPPLAGGEAGATAAHRCSYM